MSKLKRSHRAVCVESISQILFLVGFVLAGVLLDASSAQAISFQGIGQFSGGGVSTGAWGVSGDGTWVAARAQVGQGPEATRLVRWSAATGLENLGTGIAFGVSNDGAVLTGVGAGSLSGNAVRWTQPTGIVALGATASSTARHAADTSADGSVIVGRTANSRAFRWTQATGAIELPGIDGNAFGNAEAISADASIVVGGSRGSAVLWAGGNAPIDLGLLSGTTNAEAIGLSADGTKVVGRSGNRAFLWTEQTGMQDLGFASPDSTMSSAFDVSGDGTVVVGTTSFSGEVSDAATIWDPINGQRLLLDVLAAELDMTGWKLLLASAISDDGLTIVGIGENPNGQIEGWIAVVPEPSSALLIGLGMISLAARRRNQFRSDP